MYLISELAANLGVSRTTLLYYERLGLVTGQRLDNGYRYYSEGDLQRLILIQQLQSAGLSLKECQECLQAKLDKSLLESRLNQLNEEIEKKQHARELLMALLGKPTLGGADPECSCPKVCYASKYATGSQLVFM